MSKTCQTLARLVSALRAPRPAPAVYRDFNFLRQSYVLQVAAAHFGLPPDHPAPLYGKTLLDVGCGESTVAEFLALSGADITAIDANARVLEKASQSAENFGAPIRFIHTSAEGLLHQPQKFDVILALDILEETTNPGKLVWLLRQLLAPGGIIIFSNINRSFRAWLVHIMLSGYVYRRTLPGARRFSWFYSPQHLRQLCRAAGLVVSNVQGMRFSVSKQRWKFTSAPHTRYLASATAV